MGLGRGSSQMTQPPAEKPSPLAAFVTAITGMADARKLIGGAASWLDHGPDPRWSVMLDDLEMMLHERVIIGLRSPWVRRVAVPVFQAYRALHAREGDDKDRARHAIEILGQCTDCNVQAECRNWIREKYHVQ